MSQNYAPKAKRPVASGDKANSAAPAGKGHAAPSGAKNRWTDADRRKRDDRPARGDRAAQPRADRPARPAKG